MLVMVVVVFANNFLLARMAENEFNAAKQFMRTIGMQVDDVSWTIGRTETARYTNKYGSVAFVSALNYTVYINTTESQSNKKFYTAKTGILCYKVPTSSYSLGNSFFELIYPSNSSFLLSGASVPVARIFTVEKLSEMPDGSFVRVVAAPILRMVNLTIGSTSYVRLFLPLLVKGDAPNRYPTVTMNGQSLSRLGEHVTGIKVVVSFPQAGFNEFFFNFPRTVESIRLISESVLELYVGSADVDLGVNP